jgi:hypothetical protein
MDQQQRPSDTPVETIAKTVPGEFISLVVLLKTFLDDDKNLLVIGLFVSLLVPVYAARVLNVSSWSQRILMFVSYVAWLFMLIPDQADILLMTLTNSIFSLKTNIKLFAAFVLVLQFALPFLIKPTSKSGQTLVVDRPDADRPAVLPPQSG